jgi:glycosyltransferase involved in cell wall biosynthesis
MAIKIFPNSMSLISSSTQQFGNHVAILTRTKNRPVLLARAIASVLAQTHTNWHLYIINDGGDPDIVDQLTQRYEGAFLGRLTVIHHEKSQGMEAASNAGLERSRGKSDFIVVHDDDDSWHPAFLSETTDFLSKEENARYAAVISHCTKVYERIENEGVIEEGRVDGFCPQTIDFGAVLQTNQFPPISLLIRRSVADKIGNFNSDLPVLGDWEYNIRILLEGDIGVISKKLAYYHHRGAADPGEYGNSVIAGVARHDLYETLYRNSVLRRLLQADPGQVGIAHMVLHQNRSNQDDLRFRLDRSQENARFLFDRNDGHNHNRFLELLTRTDNIHRSVDQLSHSVIQLSQNIEKISAMAGSLEKASATAHSLEQAMRPARWIWRRMFPVRRFIAILRGHV